MKAGFVVVDKHRRGDVHGIDEHKSFFYPTLAKAVLHLRRDVDEGYPCRRVEPKLFAVVFHRSAPSLSGSTEPCIETGGKATTSKSVFTFLNWICNSACPKNSPNPLLKGGIKSLPL